MNEITENMKQKAVQVHERICVYAQKAQEDIYMMGKAMNEMNEEKLYEAIGFESFESYCIENFGLKKSQAYKYISIYKNLGENFMIENPKLGLSKSYLLSQLTEDERNEIVEQSDINEASVKELKEQIEKMKEENEKLQCSFFEVEKKKDAAMSEADKLKEKIKQADKLLARNEELKLRIKELEEKPVDVAVSEPDPAVLEARAEEIATEKTITARKRIEELSKKLEESEKAERKIRAQLGTVSSLTYDNEMLREKIKQLEEKSGETKICDPDPLELETRAEEIANEKIEEIQKEAKEEISRMKEDFDKKIENILQASQNENSTDSTQVEAPDTALPVKEQFKVYLKNAITLINQALEFANTTDQKDFLINQLKTAIRKIGDKL